MEILRIPQTKPSGQPIPAEALEDAPAMEIAHVLFMDVVGFSQLRMQQQARIQVELQNLVQATTEVIQARKDGKLIVRPTGDGMALLFLRDLLSPVRCALQLHTLIQSQDAQIRQRIGAPIQLRMGIHSGSVLLVEDMNAQSDVAGEGIILAQRVMDCGDSGHILLSDEVAKKLLNMDPWPRYITDLGEVRVKHGVKVHLFNLYGRLDGPYCGNPAKPEKVKADAAARAAEERAYRGTYFERNPEVKKWGSILLTTAALAGAGYTLYTRVPAVPKFVQGTYTSALAYVQTIGKPQKEMPSLEGSPKPDRPNSPTNTPSQTTRRLETAAQQTIIPSLVGLTTEAARAELRSVGLKMVSTGSEYNEQWARGIVFRQYPEPGKTVKLGQSVKVRISRGDRPQQAAPDPTIPEETPEPVVPDSSRTDEGVLGTLDTDDSVSSETSPEVEASPAPQRPRPLRAFARRLRQRSENSSNQEE